MRTWGGRFSGDTDERVAAFTSSIAIDAALAADDIAGSIAHVRGLGRAGHPDRRRGRHARRRADRARRGDRRRPLRLGPGPRGRPHERRGRARDADRAARRTPAHGPVAQRPGRHGPAALDAPLDRRARRRARRVRARARRARRTRRHGRPARARPTSSRPSRSCSPITCWPTSRWPNATAADCATPAPGSTSRRSGPGRWPVPATRSIARRRRRSSASMASRANSLDAVSDRDFAVETMAAIALGMVHLSRLAEEITWWSNPRFGFVRVADAFSTGSSMMPNKKNPDPAELVRGRAARVIGELTGMLDPAQGPAARVPARPPGGRRAAVRCGRRVRDLARASWPACSRRSPSTRRGWPRPPREGYTTATAVADALVRRGVAVPDRPPHRRVAGGRGRGRRRRRSTGSATR